jgi:hypothetical protein
VLLILTHKADECALTLVSRWKNRNAKLLTPEDLSVPGCLYQPGRIKRGTIVIEERIASVSEIDGVLVRLPCIAPHDLPHIHSADRSYVAAEMTSFLAAWLNELPIPVVNRPTPLCLFGPAWTPERWSHEAAKAGIPVIPDERIFNGSDRPRPYSASPIDIQLTIIGERCFGPADEELARASLRLARSAKVDLLGLYFSRHTSGHRFVAAGLCPALQSEEEIGALRQLFHTPAARRNHRSRAATTFIGKGQNRSTPKEPLGK